MEARKKSTFVQTDFYLTIMHIWHVVFHENPSTHIVQVLEEGEQRGGSVASRDV